MLEKQIAERGAIFSLRMNMVHTFEYEVNLLRLVISANCHRHKMEFSCAELSIVQRLQNSL
jgi:hypothetical protein